MRFRGVVFDLDGTLLDSLADIAAAANRVLETLGYPTHPESDYARFVGDGARVLFRRCLPERVNSNDETLDRAMSAFKQAYDDEWNRTSGPYVGIADLLDGLQERGVAMAVLSNKPDEFTRKCVSHYFNDWSFRAIYGERESEGVARKPDAAGALAVAKELGLRPDEVLFVGDTAVDIATARAAGMRAIGVAWGFRPISELAEAGADLVVERPSEILGLVDGTTSLRAAHESLYDTDPGI